MACIDDFSKPAIEFAANNKIFLLSLSWFLDQTAIQTFHSIDQQYVNGIGEDTITRVYEYFKDRKSDAEHDNRNHVAKNYLNNDVRIGRVITAFNNIINRLFVGIIESGDLVFFFAHNEDAAYRLIDIQRFTGFKGQIHYSPQKPNIWHLTVKSEFQLENIVEFDFFVPHMIMDLWGEYNMEREKAVDMKAEYFSRFFIFNRGIRPELPFFIINIDREWLNQLRAHQGNLG